ncbi:hypothetical protein ACUND2_22490 [Serratia sp. IR-2025]
MTFNEARAALAVGCGIYLPGYLIKIISIEDTEITYSGLINGNLYKIPIPDTFRNATNWGIYNENKRSNTSS